MKNNKFLSYSLVREEKNEYNMHLMDIGHAWSWLDGYSYKGDVGDSKNIEIVINSYGY